MNDCNNRQYVNKKARQGQANSTTEQMNATIEEIKEAEEQIMFRIEKRGVWFNESEIRQCPGFKEYENPNPNDEQLLYYDWLADSTATLHICKSRDTFIEYNAESRKAIVSVGGVKAAIKGQGTVHLLSKCNGHLYSLTLENLLHIPINRNNLLSLG